jgi:hypothetical protein
MGDRQRASSGFVKIEQLSRAPSTHRTSFPIDLQQKIESLVENIRTQTPILFDEVL